MIDLDVRPLIYGVYTPIKRIAEVYNVTRDFMDRVLCRADFNCYAVPNTRPRLYMWTPAFEADLDRYLVTKGKRRCIGSKVLCKSLLEKANSYLTSTITGTHTIGFSTMRK